MTRSVLSLYSGAGGLDYGLEAAGFEVKSGTPEEFAELLTRSFETYRRITSEAGIKPE